LNGDDWQALADLAISHHRVGPKVWAALKAAARDSVPSDVAARFEAESRRAAIYALASKAETARVVSALNRLGITPCILKGWALEEDLFGRLGRRVTRDIDLMISDQDLPAASEALQGLGYSCALTKAYNTRDAIDSFLRFSHQLVFYRPTSQTMVELHLRPFRNRHLYARADLQTEVRESEICDVTVQYEVPTLSANFVYLALHGYSHRWKRAKWLVDIPPLLGRLSSSDWQLIRQQARDLAIERTLGVSLVLSRDLLKTDIPGPAQALLAQADGSYRAAACRRELLATEPHLDRPTVRRWLDSHIVNLFPSSRLPVIGAALQTLVVRESDVLPSRLANRYQVLHYLSAALNVPKRLGRRVLRRH